jgi:hypothetical protein
MPNIDIKYKQFCTVNLALECDAMMLLTLSVVKLL